MAPDSKPDVPKRLVNTMRGHTASVLAVRATLTGGYCLTGSKDRSVRLWNPAKGLQINTYKGNGGDVRGLAVSHDNRTFLSCGTDRLVNFFDVATGSVIRRFSGHDAAVNAVSFAAEESLAVSTSYDATVRFWDMKSRNTRPIDVVKVATDSVTGLAVPSSVPLVVTSAVDGIITTLDIRKGELVKDDMHVPVSTISVPEDALYIVAACTDDTVRLLDRKKGSVIGSYTGHRHKDFQVECGLICHDSVAVCGSEDAPIGVHSDMNTSTAGTVHMWDLVSKQSCGKLDAHKGVVSSVCGVPKSQRLLTAGADCEVKLWDF